MRTQIYISAIFLFLVQNFASIAAGGLPPPVNVSIHCDNYGVEVRWKYPDPAHDVNFWVDVIAHLPKTDGGNGIPFVKTQNMSLDISGMLFKSSTNHYYVAVMAERGGNKSSVAKSPQFSFCEDSNTEVFKCRLDFPKVELSAKDGKLHVKFINPVRLYRDTPALSNLSDHLTYFLDTEESSDYDSPVECEKQSETCETSMSFSEHRGNYCVSVSGRIGQRYLNPIHDCFIGDIRTYPPFTVYLYPLLGVAATILLLTGIFMLLSKKFNQEIKKAIPPLPPSLLKWDGKTQKREFTVLELDPESFERHPLVLPTEKSVDQTSILEDEDTQASLSKSLEYGFSEKSTANELSDEEQDEPYETSEGYDMGHGLRAEIFPGEFLEAYGREAEK